MNHPFSIPHLLNLTRRLIWRAGLLALPRHWHLPLRYELDIRGACEQELLHLKKLGPNSGVAVDIGANAGVYSYALSRLYDTVYAFEPNEEVLPMLRAYRGGDIRVVARGLSDKAGETILHVPQVRGQDLTGWATLDPHVYPRVHDFRTLAVSIDTLDSYDLPAVSFIKIDVEGLEPHVLEGARETIQRCRPHVLIEIKPDHLQRVHDFFSGYNYDIKRLNQITDAEPSGNNVVFTPRARTEE